jgi:hypothetical protein
MPNDNAFRGLISLGFFLATAAFLHAGEDTKSFQVRGSNPDGKTGYTGTVEVRKNGETMDVRWVTGKDNAETIGFGIKGEDTLGAGYGGASLYSIAVYELKGKRIHATWALTSKPGTVGKYDLKGSANFEGSYKFSDGAPGTVTMTPAGDGSYKMKWDLATGHYEGIGVKFGNALVAVAGEPGARLGVAAYRPSGNDIEGVWTNVGLGGVGKELWSLPGEEKTAQSSGPGASKDGKTISFAGEEYSIKSNTSNPGQPTSEQREYLRQGEEWEGYRKMVALRMMSKSLKGDAADIAKGILAETKKGFPDSFTKEVLLEPDHAVVLFIVISGKDAELNLWDIRRTGNGFPSVQFVLRNKAPYDTIEKFKAEQDKNYDTWLKEAAALNGHAEEILATTAAGNAPPTAPTAGNGATPELAEAIGADLKKCGAVGEKFIGLIKEGDTKGAVALMSDKAFTKYTREEFASGLAKVNKLLGPLQDFTPDKDATDFGVVDGVMTFTLKGNAKYANGAAKETLRFIRTKGEIEFVSYSRETK